MMSPLRPWKGLLVFGLAAVIIPTRGYAQQAAPTTTAVEPIAKTPTDGEAAADETVEQAATDDDADQLEEERRLEDEDQIAALREEVHDLHGVVAERSPRVTISGYGDFGFFVPEGTGVGYIQDVGPPAARYFPQYYGRYAWVFLGDILAPAINTRGEPADLGNPPGVNREDLVDSNGKPGFIVNEVNLRLDAALADNVIGLTSINFRPRTGTDFRFGDAFDVDIVSLQWMIGRQRKTSIYVGKIEGVLGIEYRERKSDQRFGITPSLIARYTTGTPLGIKARSFLGTNDWLILAGALTNGSSVIEPFHFYDETDSNAGKTASGRVAVTHPFRLRGDTLRVEVGASGSYGAQDRALDSRHPMWFAGADLQASWRWWQLRGEWLRGSADGEVGPPVDLAHRVYGLRLNNGAYLELATMLTSVMGALVRVGMRDAFVWLGDPTLAGGADRLYVTKSWRLTVGVRAVINDHIVLKAEALFNEEYGGVPPIPNDVFTTSLVMSF
jgi:hypothetical protein